MPSLLSTGAIAFLLCLGFTPALRALLRRSRRTESRQGLAIPRMGGLAVLAAASLAVVACFALGLSRVRPALASAASLRALAVPLVLIVLVGIADDLVELAPLWKFAGQLIAATMVVTAGIHITLVLDYRVPAWLSIPVTLIWLIGCTNAFNLIDGLDGLACGLALFATGTVLAHAVLTGQPGLALLMAALFGALAGFLVFNFEPASIFLGDTGSLAVGFLLGALALLWADKSTTLVGLMAPSLILLVPLTDTLLAILRRRLGRRGIFSRDRAHVHHRLLERGLTIRHAVLTLYCVGGAAAVGSLLLADLHRHVNGELVILLFVVLLAVGVHQLGYTELSEVGRSFSRDTRQRAAAFAALARLQERVAAVPDPGAVRQALAEAAAALGFAAIDFDTDAVPPPPADPHGWYCEIPLPSGRLRLWGPWSRPRAVSLDELAVALRGALAPVLAQPAARAHAAAAGASH